MPEGLTPRDWFAAHATPNDIYANAGIPDKLLEKFMDTPCPDYLQDPLENAKWWATATAKWKYMMADAMLKERNG